MDTDNPEPRHIISDLTNENEASDSKETPGFDISRRQMISRASVPIGVNDNAYKHPIEPLKVPSTSANDPPAIKAPTIPVTESEPFIAKPPVSKEPEVETTAVKNPNSSLSDKVYRDIGGRIVPTTNKLAETPKKDSTREKQIEEYIKDRAFFVPIHSVAQKKTVKVSGGLTILVIILSLVLIDLMLDSGVILFVQKLPHTHFFSQNRDN